MQFKYVQIGAKDYKKLAAFYESALYFEKCDETSWLNGNEGVVLKAPGFKDDNPIYFGFINGKTNDVAKINDIGYAHTCYETQDVSFMVKRLKKYGGSFQSTLNSKTINPCVYCKDPEGNVVEFHIPFPSPDAKTSLTVKSLLGLKKDKEGKTLRFIHVNMISNDWTALCDFYKNTFNAVDFGKLKDHSGGYKEKVIGIKGVHVIGHHILLPYYFNSYPTFEIFTYSIKGREKPCDEMAIGINAIGFISNSLDDDIKLIENNKGKLIIKNDNLAIVEDSQGDRIFIREE